MRTWKLLSELYEAGSSINLISSYQESYDKIDVDATQALIKTDLAFIKTELRRINWTNLINDIDIVTIA